MQKKDWKQYPCNIEPSLELSRFCLNNQSIKANFRALTQFTYLKGWFINIYIDIDYCDLSLAFQLYEKGKICSSSSKYGWKWQGKLKSVVECFEHCKQVGLFAFKRNSGDCSCYTKVEVGGNCALFSFKNYDLYRVLLH